MFLFYYDSASVSSFPILFVCKCKGMQNLLQSGCKYQVSQKLIAMESYKLVLAIPSRLYENPSYKVDMADLFYLNI